MLPRLPCSAFAPPVNESKPSETQSDYAVVVRLFDYTALTASLYACT